MKFTLSLNPCFSGLYYLTQLVELMHRLGDVLILVLVDFTT